jgi:hypothetical protein
MIHRETKRAFWSARTWPRFKAATCRRSPKINSVDDIQNRFVIFPKANQRTNFSGLSRQHRRREILTQCDYVATRESRIEHRVELLSEKAIL